MTTGQPVRPHAPSPQLTLRAPTLTTHVMRLLLPYPRRAEHQLCKRFSPLHWADEGSLAIRCLVMLSRMGNQHSGKVEWRRLFPAFSS